VVREIREKAPFAAVELLVPDFRGSVEALRLVVMSGPDVLAHNLETVPRLYPEVRPGAVYRRSLELIRRAREMDPPLELKSGIMAGFGESREELVSVMEDLYAAGCRSLTVGQYLSPTRNHLPVREYLTVEAFSELAEAARRIGFPRVAAGPLVRSSYKAGASK
jgi:lipoic acid synthetase